jgi:hypothetical protein
MATIKANGRPLQGVIDSECNSGDTLDIGSATYAGPVKAGKQLHIVGTGAIEGGSKVLELQVDGSSAAGFTIRGARTDDPKKDNCSGLSLATAHDVHLADLVIEDNEGYGVRAYESDRVTAERLWIEGAAQCFKADKSGGHTLTDVTMSADRMLIDDGTLAVTGGNAFVVYKSKGHGTITLIRPVILKARARTNSDVGWNWDGSAFEWYGACDAAIIEDWKASDSVNILETGTSTPTEVGTGWVLRNGDAYGNAAGHGEEETSCQGLYVRAGNGMLVEGNRFHSLDDFVLQITSGGSYEGAMAGNRFIGNWIGLKPGTSESDYRQHSAYIIGGAVADTYHDAFTEVDGNTVVFDPENTPAIAVLSGTGNTNDLAQWREWTGYGATDEWVSEGDVDPVPVPDCEELEMALTAVTAERDQALAELAQIHTISAP